ncbi:hypothetical protein CLG96_08155 [Sphingomonas oleivorans]|uniref:Uncharacterized protein n=1 Tax=Sphingomonas oleivorans TaxID=1735121 RepID=A0A2T5FZ47_9SPHN|nr:hypothetical protein [Sphingomonas oleivorans]PTQ11877.1 hypothetical protein CLG96_08155 [Sphingomonas oleivorans]
MLKTISIGLASVLGLAAIGNGLYMLNSPANWYFAVPGVTTTGPFNQHFIRDIGLIFLFLGGAFLIGASRPDVRIFFWGAATTWLWGHALFHFWEVAVGICGPSAIARDFPAVTLPAILGTLLTIWAVIDARQSARTRRATLFNTPA